jgi:hypothetical protein
LGKRVIKINAKCGDRCQVSVIENGATVQDKNGYVPSGLGIGGGDYIRLEIDADTGHILNWKTPASVDEIFSGE